MSGRRHSTGAACWSQRVQGTARPGSPWLTHIRYQVVVFTNQGGISLTEDPKTIKGDLKRVKVFKEKVSTVLQQLNLPISLYAATTRDKFRKPRMGMWEEMLEDYDLDLGHTIDLDGSFFVGDAGGRQGVDGSVADHSCSDR